MSEDTIRGFTVLQQRIIDLIETGCVEQRLLVPNIQLDVIVNSDQKKRIVERELTKLRKRGVIRFGVVHPVSLENLRIWCVIPKEKWR